MSTTDLQHHKKIFGHPAGLYVLFFVEMWERFLIMVCVQS